MAGAAWACVVEGGRLVAVTLTGDGGGPLWVPFNPSLEVRSVGNPAFLRLQTCTCLLLHHHFHLHWPCAALNC
jgi:hypothetical protein